MRIKSDEKALDYAALKDELEKFYILTPNKNFRSRNYYKYKDEEDPTLIKRWLKNKHSEKPSILDTTLIRKSEKNIQNYLRNKKGFYQAQVTSQVKNSPSSKLARIVYKVDTGTRYKINKIYHISRDSSLTELLDTIAQRSIIKDNDPIDAFSFDIEKQRIVSEFQKNGYADFNLTNVEIKGDSTGLKNSWDIFFMILPPAGSSSHQNFTVGDIYVYTDSHNNQQESQLETEYLFGKYYKHQSRKFIVRPSTIDRKIYLRKYDAYNSENYYKTIRSLFSLGSYRFAKLTPRVNPSDSTLIDYNIYLTPQGSKWALDTGLEAFYSNISVLNNNLVGIASSLGIEDRNAFGGSERFKTSLEAGVEINPADLQIKVISVLDSIS